MTKVVVEAETKQASSNTTPEPEPQVKPVKRKTPPTPKLNFPPELFGEFFKRFSPNTLQNVREVSKQFRANADLSSRRFIDELVVKPYDSRLFLEEPGYHRNHRWYLTAQYARPGDFVPRFPPLPPVPSVSPVPPPYILGGLRRLAVLGISSTDLVPILGSCKKLTQLEIDVFFPSDSVDIKLPNLQVLRVDCVGFRPVAGGRDWRLRFVSPKLFALCLGDLYANERIVVSNPECVTHYEFDQLPEGALVDQGRFAFPNLETVICTDVLRNRSSGIDSLVKLKTLRKLHLFIGGVSAIRRLYVVPNLNEHEASDRIQQWLKAFKFIFRVMRSIPRDDDGEILDGFTGKQFYLQGIDFNWLITPPRLPSKDPNIIAPLSMIQQHILNREHLAPSFRHCSSLRFDRPFLFKLAPFLTGGLDFRSTYEYVKELHVELTCLVPKLLLKLPSLCQRIPDLSQALVELHPVPANRRRLQSVPSDRPPRGPAEEFADIEEANHFERPPPNRIVDQYRADVLKHLRTLESELNENAESWVLQFIANFHLAYLNLSYNGLSQNFYNRLAQRTHLTASVNKLVLFEEKYNGITDTSFLLAFNQLYLFKTNLFPRHSLTEQPFINVLLQSLKHAGRCELHLTEPLGVATIQKYRHRSRSLNGLKKTRYTVLANGERKEKLRLKSLKVALTRVSENMPLNDQNNRNQ